MGDRNCVGKLTQLTKQTDSRFFSLGPVIGGAFADSTATWRWSFYLNLCVGAVAAPIYFFIVPRHNPCANVPLLSRILQLDFVGGILNAGAYTSLIMAVSFAGSTYNWNSSQIIGLFVCTGILWPLFFLQQNSSTLTTAEHRILPFSLLWVPGMVILFVQITIGMIITYIPMYFIPLFFQFSKGDSALMAAVRLLPFIFMQVFGTILNGATMAKFQYYMPWYLLGGILALIGGSLFYTVDMETQSRNIYGYSVILGLGSGLFAQASFAVSQAKVDARLIPVATALIGCGQITGVTFALTISSNIFQNRATQRITRLMPDSPRRTIQNAILGTDSTFIGTLDPIRRIQVLKAISKSIQEVYVMVIAASSLVIILSLMMKHEKLLKHHRSTKAPKEEDMAHAWLSKTQKQSACGWWLVTNFGAVPWYNTDFSTGFAIFLYSGRALWLSCHLAMYLLRNTERGGLMLRRCLTKPIET